MLVCDYQFVTAEAMTTFEAHRRLSEVLDKTYPSILDLSSKIESNFDVAFEVFDEEVTFWNLIMRASSR